RAARPVGVRRRRTVGQPELTACGARPGSGRGGPLTLPPFAPISSEPLGVHPDRADRVVTAEIEGETRISLVLRSSLHGELTLDGVDARSRLAREACSNRFGPR